MRRAHGPGGLGLLGGVQLPLALRRHGGSLRAARSRGRRGGREARDWHVANLDGELEEGRFGEMTAAEWVRLRDGHGDDERVWARDCLSTLDLAAGSVASPAAARTLRAEAPAATPGTLAVRAASVQAPAAMREPPGADPLVDFSAPRASPSAVTGSAPGGPRQPLRVDGLLFDDAIFDFMPAPERGGEVSQDLFCVCERDLSHLWTKLGRGEGIVMADVAGLVSPWALADDEVVVPVDMRGQDWDTEDVQDLAARIGLRKHRARLFCRQGPAGTSLTRTASSWGTASRQ